MERFDLESFPTSESARRMLGYVSDGFYDRSYVGKWLYQAMGLEYDEAREIAESLPAQFFPETATWGLAYHETKWGLPVRENLPYEERRRLIYERRDYRAPMTPYRMERYLADMTGFEVHIADINDPGEYGFVPRHPNVFKAYFIGEGSLDSGLVFGILRRLKQSHTTFAVNDRVEIELCSRGMEQIALGNVRARAAILFWESRCMEGGTGEYALCLGIDCSGAFSAEEDIGMAAEVFMGGVPVPERAAAVGQGIRAGIEFWGSMHSDSSRGIRTAVRIKAEAPHIPEGFGNATAVSRRNVAYFDGSLPMDGTRLMNSVYREEDI